MIDIVWVLQTSLAVLLAVIVVVGSYKFITNFPRDSHSRWSNRGNTPSSYRWGQQRNGDEADEDRYDY